MPFSGFKFRHSWLTGLPLLWEYLNLIVSSVYTFILTSAYPVIMYKWESHGNSLFKWCWYPEININSQACQTQTCTLTRPVSLSIQMSLVPNIGSAISLTWFLNQTFVCVRRSPRAGTDAADSGIHSGSPWRRPTGAPKYNTGLYQERHVRTTHAARQAIAWSQPWWLVALEVFQNTCSY